jgi:hypothetical protein
MATRLTNAISFMNSRLLLRLLSLLILATASRLTAQDQQPTNDPAATPAQAPADGTMPAPSLFAPEGQGSVTPTPDVTASSNATSAPLTLDTNAPAKSAADAAAPAGDTNVPSPGDTNTPAVPDPMAPAPDSGMGSPGQNPPLSDPNALIPPVEQEQQPSPVNASGNEEKQRQDQKTRYYAVKVKADKEPELSSLLEKADKAKSDEARRQALREYYDLLAKRMKKLDSGISDWIDTMHAAYLRRLEQLRVEPTIPVNPPPAVSPGSDAAPDSTPSPTPRRKRRSAAAN